MTTPPLEKYYHVSQSPLSIARHYGGININGHFYTYNPTDDTLILKPKRKK